MEIEYARFLMHDSDIHREKVWQGLAKKKEKGRVNKFVWMCQGIQTKISPQA